MALGCLYPRKLHVPLSLHTLSKNLKWQHLTLSVLLCCICKLEQRAVRGKKGRRERWSPSPRDAALLLLSRTFIFSACNLAIKTSPAEPFKREDKKSNSALPQQCSLEDDMYLTRLGFSKVKEWFIFQTCKTFTKSQSLSKTLNAASWLLALSFSTRQWCFLSEVLIYLWLSINHKYVLIAKLKVCMSCTGIMYVHYRVSWYPEPVFVTYPLPQEGKDPRQTPWFCTSFLYATSIL